METAIRAAMTTLGAGLLALETGHHGAHRLLRGAEQIRQLVVFGDGVRWILGPRRPALPGSWRTNQLTHLDNGNVDEILAAAREYPVAGVHADQREKDLAYFTTNGHRMLRPLSFAGHGRPIRRRRSRPQSLIGQRLKLAGMPWSARGATGISTLRCDHASGRWTHVGAV